MCINISAYLQGSKALTCQVLPLSIQPAEKNPPAGFQFPLQGLLIPFDDHVVAVLVY